MIMKPFWNPLDCCGFIFDWDGVIAETKLDFSMVRERYFEGKNVPILEEMQKLPLEKKNKLAQELREIEIAGAYAATVVPGAFEMIEELKKNGIPWSVVSRNCRESMDIAASTIGFKLPKNTFSRESGPIKPTPEALWMASSSMGVHHKDCLVIGDFIYDLLGARRAGMRAVLVQRMNSEWSRWSDASFAKVTDFLLTFYDDKPFVAWEYRQLVAQRGIDWLCKAWKIPVFLSGKAITPGDIGLCLELAELGVGRFFVDSSEQALSLESWYEESSLPLSDLASPFYKVLKENLIRRYPLISVNVGDFGVPVSRFRYNVVDVLQEVMES